MLVLLRRSAWKAQVGRSAEEIMTTGINNLRTGGIDYIDRDIANAFDYIPQDYEAQRNYWEYIKEGMSPKKAAIKVIEERLDIEQFNNRYSDVFGDLMVNRNSLLRCGRNRRWLDPDDPHREFTGGFVTTELEKYQIGIVEFIKPLLQGAKAEMMMEYTAIGIKGYVWSDPDEIKIYDNEFPEDWWQAFKERWFPQWLKQRYPVKCKRFVVNARALYPTYKPNVPDHQPVLRIERVE